MEFPNQNCMLVVAGANGSGKSTLAFELQKRYEIKFINADVIAKELDPSNTTGGELNAGRIFFKEINNCFQNSESFILESTLSGKYTKRLFQRAIENGYTIKIIYIYLEDPELCILRIKERVEKGGHFVPDEAVIRRYFRSAQNFWNDYKTDSHEWFMVHNSNLGFKEFCLGTHENYQILDKVKFNEFIKKGSL